MICLFVVAVVQVVRERLTTDVEDIMIPHYSEIKGFSWNETSDFVLIPKETAKKVQGTLVVTDFLKCCD